MMAETTLLPCPFCGGEAHISDDYSSKRGMVYSVWHDCPAGGGYHPYGQGVGVLQVTSAWFSSREEAIAAWNTRATHGTLTAEQVREAIERHVEFYEGGDYDEQVIADELNATLGGGTCEMYRDEYGTWHCKSCESGADTDTGSDGTLDTWCDAWPPNYCPNCGRKVVS